MRISPALVAIADIDACQADNTAGSLPVRESLYKKYFVTFEADQATRPR